VALRQVEGFEVVPVALDLRPFLHRVADPREDHLELPAHLAEHMRVPALERGPRERDVDLLGRTDVGKTGGLVFGASRRKRRLDRPLRLVGLLAKRRPLQWIELRDARQQLAADLALAASEVLDLDRFQLGIAVCLRDRGESAVTKLRGVAHAAFLRAISNMITATAAATFSDSTPRPSGIVTSFMPPRERP